MSSSDNSWTLRGPLFDLIISRPHIGGSPARGVEDPGVVVIHYLDRWLSSSHASTLFEIYRALGGPEPMGHTVPQREDFHQRLRRRIAEAFRMGELTVVIQRPRESAAFMLYELPPPPAPAPAPQPEPERTFISIRLVDEEGNPLPNQRYSIILPDGARRTGMTNSRGEAREADVPQGSCKVSFPDLDADSWS